MAHFAWLCDRELGCARKHRLAPLKRTMRSSTAFVLLLAGSTARGARNGLDLVPPMGWSNWENSGCNVNETYVRASAQALIDKGLFEVGYDIVEVDDCWANLERNSSGHMVANATRFPSGMKALGDFLHAKGMKLGMYSSAGGHCCQHTMPGSLGYEWIDARDFASFGVDFLKYDGCFMEEYASVEQDAQRRYPFTPPPVMRYPIMAMALNKTGRPISFMCNFPWQFWGLDKDPAMGGRWVSEVCNSWRVAGDPQPGFDRALGYVNSVEQYADAVPSAPGGWATLDAIEIGNAQSFDVLPAASNGAWDGRSPLSRIGPGGGAMTADQERAVFSLYAIVKTPLFIGADVTRIAGHSLEALTNKEAIAVHQDPLGDAGRRLSQQAGGTEVWGCKLSRGRAAAVLLNRGTSTAPLISLPWALLGFSNSSTCAVRDLWRHSELGNFSNFSAKDVPPTSAVMVEVRGCHL